MRNVDNELIFPPSAIPELGKLRGKSWQALVTRLSQVDETSAECLAFILMMVRINGCASCNANSYRALHGCTQCAIQSLRRFRGTDQNLLGLYREAMSEIVPRQRKKP